MLLGSADSGSPKVAATDVSNDKATDAATHCQHLRSCSGSQYHRVLYAAAQDSNYSTSGCSVVTSKLNDGKSLRTVFAVRGFQKDPK